MTPIVTPTLAQPVAAKLPAKPEIIWEKLPANFILPDDPVESIAQPLLAAALTESLDLSGRITSEMLIASNMAIAVKINQKTNVKAPDWFYVAKAMRLSGGLIRRSYTPHTEGEVPAIVMEFLSEEETGEYSMRPIFPYGKMYFYEQILQVPLYLIFDPDDGRFEIRKLEPSGKYELQPLDENGRYFFESLDLYLGVWYGKRLDQQFHWLRWWDTSGNLLLWGSEKLEQERLVLEAEKQKAETERQRAEAENLRAEAERQRAEAEKQKAEAENLRAEAEKHRADLAEQEILRLKQLLADSQIN
ncbi:Uma2 family endonuclease [Tumidithrix elongata RA019]|uniref:Uma2 family endonuclease n=1 Tax=Tumidithrix elongata BACA0141 TaxID=2716417 RepID=A0AAW9PWB3_9CYAN|nr:Uma2 family endonuclease [Tumidithrix elongata RA019]